MPWHGIGKHGDVVVRQKPVETSQNPTCMLCGERTHAHACTHVRVRTEHTHTHNGMTRCARAAAGAARKNIRNESYNARWGRITANTQTHTHSHAHTHTHAFMHSQHCCMPSAFITRFLLTHTTSAPVDSIDPGARLSPVDKPAGGLRVYGRRQCTVFCLLSRARVRELRQHLSTCARID